MELHGDHIVLRPLTELDCDRIVELGAHPDVARWWPDITPKNVLTKARGAGGVTAFAIVVDGEVAGLIQYDEELDPEYRRAGIDIFLGAPYHGRGLGTDAVRTMVAHLVQDLGHHRVIIDPAADNPAAIRCYEKVGFRRVGVMREYWCDGEGVWRNSVLLDLLASDLSQSDTRA
jgi:aminoglycoside 6'-N-acetyltransferase